MSTVVVRRLRATEWRELRELRLEALRDAPGAFATTLAEAAERDDGRWQADAARAAHAEHPTFVATIDGRFVGMASGWAHDGTTELIQMFVRSGCRGAGIGRALVDAVVDWARIANAAELELGVAADNAGAERLYANCGFVRAGGPIDRADGRVSCEIRMVLTLAAPDPGRAARAASAARRAPGAGGT